MLEFTEPDQDARSAATIRPSTPKKGLRPKLTSYLSQSGPFGATSKPEPEPVFAETPIQSFPSWAVEDTFPHPSAEQLMDTILCRLMSQPYDSLNTRFNGGLLQIFEAYRELSDQRARLEKNLAEETAVRKAERSLAQEAEHRWEEEKQTYKAEVKRLELVIAKGKRGVAAVALARQDSLIQRKRQVTTPDDEYDGKETVFEFLEKTKRFEDPAWSGQRGKLRSTQQLIFRLTCGSNHEDPTSITLSEDGQAIKKADQEGIQNEYPGRIAFRHSATPYYQHVLAPGIVFGRSSETPQPGKGLTGKPLSHEGRGEGQPFG